VKTCATLPWPLSGWSLQVVFFRLTRRSQCDGSGCQGCAAERSTTGAERKEPGLDAGATRALHCVALQGGRTAASRCRPGERPPSCVHPQGLPGHGKPSMGSRPRSTQPGSERPGVQPRSVATNEGRRGTLPPHGAPAHASPASGTASPAHRSAQALTQESSGITLRAVDEGRNEAASQRQIHVRVGRSPERLGLVYRGAEPLYRAPGGGWGAGSCRTGRAQRRRCLPLCPCGGRIGEVRRSVHSSALPSRRGAGTSSGSREAVGRRCPAKGLAPPQRTYCHWRGVRPLL
jgi:hypothetical protein